MGKSWYLRNKERLENLKFSKYEGNHFVYYIPSIHKVGLTDDPDRRMKVYKKDGINVEDYKILYSSTDRKIAGYHEALFQSVLAINGLNFK